MRNQFKLNSSLTISQCDALAIQLRRDGYNATIEYVGFTQDVRLFTSAESGQVMFSALECLPAHARSCPLVEQVFPNEIAKGVMDYGNGKIVCNV